MNGIMAPQHHNEEAAREHMEAIMWPNGAVCRHCNSSEVAQLRREAGTDTHARPGTYQCRNCRKQFSVMVGTIFEDSHIPLHKWLLAIHLMCSSKKGVSAHQLWRNLWGTDSETGKQKGSYRTAWHMAHRIRWAMTQEPMFGLLGGNGGTVEADETYIGGKEKGKRGVPGPDSKKHPVVSLLERGGNVRSIVVDRVNVKNLRPIVQEFVDKQAQLHTDESLVYHFIRDEVGGHKTVNHKAKEYVRIEADGTMVTTNTVEGFFSLVKRGFIGVYHHWSKKHSHRYLTEFDFRYNVRKVADADRTTMVVGMTRGKRLMLREPIGE